ncbi:hypothetical protein DTO021C3_1142 [Paecilomyces variotii]|nr:hypothetical protein DTO021C3_1142 [Paecilomyces variotii]
MAGSRRIREAFESANAFLSPVLNREEIQKSRGDSLVQILSVKLSVAPEEENQRKAVINEALSLLGQIHRAFATPIADDEPETSTETEDVALEDAKRRRLLHALLDLISLEGVYPSLSGGVGIPLEKRVISVLPAGVIAKQTEIPADSKPRDEALLCQILKVLRDLLFDERPSIQPIIRGRILSDIISGSADLAFNARTLPLQEKEEFRDMFQKVIDQTPTQVLLPTLTAFLRTDTAPWFKSTISSHLSVIPLRPDGVLQTMIFVASQFAPSLGHDAQTPSSDGPPITVQAIMQTSKLLSSVPQGMDPVVYFENISPKLLALLDGEDLDLKRTAAYVVGSGILGKRAYGAPGTIGHSIFAEPIFKALTAELDDASQRWMRRFTGLGEALPWDGEHESPRKIIVGESQIFLGIERLRSLTLQHPNPGLVKRLLHPILLPLWGMACYAREQGKTAWHEKILTLLQTFFGMSVGVLPLKKLVDNLLWDGKPTWTYGPGENEGISLQQREKTNTQGLNLVQLVDSLDSRADEFIKLLGSDPQSEDRTADIFLYVSERWLVQPSTHQPSLNRLKLPHEQDDPEAITQKLVSAKIAEKLLENFKDTLSRHPLRVLELVKQLIEGELREYEAKESRRRDTDSGKATLASLSNIVARDQSASDAGPEQAEAGESLSAAFSLLSTILASPEFSVSEALVPTLQSIKTQLDRLTPHLPASLSKPGTTSSMLLEIHLSSPEELKENTKAAPSHVSDLETHRQALSNLNSPLPPVQAEGLSLLSNLITKSSPVLDIPSTLSLLLSLIMDTSESAANEEFIYLNVIKLIGELASRHPRTVVKTLVERYADREEERTLDQRLKLGEALLRTVQDLGDALAGETAKILGEGMISVAGRRSRKPQTHQVRKSQLEKERRQKEREARESAMPAGWSISTPSSNKESGPSISELQEDEDSDTETPEQAAQSANIVSAWAAGAASDEDPDDLRARASAISILATAIQTNLLGLGPHIASSAVDLALSTLSLEPEPESAILRRGSVVLLLDLIKAIDETRENKGSSALGFGFSLTENAGGAIGADRGRTIGNIPQILRTLLFVESRETDSIVRGHIRVLIESLEAWMEKSLMWGIGARGDREEDEEPRLELGDRLAGLSIDPLAGRDGRMGPRIEEIE